MNTSYLCCLGEKYSPQASLIDGPRSAELHPQRARIQGSKRDEHGMQRLLADSMVTRKKPCVALQAKAKLTAGQFRLPSTANAMPKHLSALQTHPSTVCD